VARKYFWLKLKDDFFTSKEIKKLRRIAGGDTYTIIYLKMQLLSIKKEGLIVYEGTEKDIVEQLSLELDEDEENVKMTLAFLQQNKLIEQIDDDEFLLNKVPELVGSETTAAARMRKMREKKNKEEKKIEENRNKVTPQLQDVQNCYTEKEKRREEQEIDIEQEQDKELDLDKEIDNNNKKNDDDCCDYNNDLLSEDEVKEKNKESDFKKIATLYQQCIGPANSYTRDWIIDNLSDFGYEWFSNALIIAEKNGKRTKSYVEGILRNWNNNGGMDLEGKKKPNQKQGKKVNTQFHNFKQRTTKYSAEELEDKVRKKFGNQIK